MLHEHRVTEQNVILQVPPETDWHPIKTFLSHTVEKLQSGTGEQQL